MRAPSLSLVSVASRPAHPPLLSAAVFPRLAYQDAGGFSLSLSLTPAHTPPCGLLQLVCEDVNVDRFYPVLYPKVSTLNCSPRVCRSGRRSEHLLVPFVAGPSLFAMMTVHPPTVCSRKHRRVCVLCLPKDSLQIKGPTWSLAHACNISHCLESFLGQSVLSTSFSCFLPSKGYRETE